MDTAFWRDNSLAKTVARCIALHCRHVTAHKGFPVRISLLAFSMALSGAALAAAPPISDSLKFWSALKADPKRNRLYCEHQRHMADVIEAKNAKDEARSKAATRKAADAEKRLVALSPDFIAHSNAPMLVITGGSNREGDGKKLVEIWAAVNEGCAKGAKK
jgi:hypothetical protein